MQRGNIKKNNDIQGASYLCTQKKDKFPFPQQDCKKNIKFTYMRQ